MTSLRWYAASFILTAVILGGAWAVGGRPAVVPAPPRMPKPGVHVRGRGNLARLSMQAQSLISSAVGAGDPGFAPVRRRGGFGLVGGHLEAGFGRSGMSVGGNQARLSLRLVAAGRIGHVRDLPKVGPRVRSARVVYARADGVREWYRAGPLGIEQGFTLTRRPAGAVGAVTLAVGVRGLRARLTDAGVEFRTHSGRVALRYGGLVARDARGRRVSAWMSLSHSRLQLQIADRGARYPVLVDPFIQQGAKLTASDETGNGSFGEAVAVSADGNTALIGGSDDNNQTGAAWVFTRSDGTWTQQGPKLTARDESGQGWFGESVALSADGNAALIGGAADGGSTGVYGDGAAWVFTRTGSTWTQQGAKLTAADQSSFGQSVALSGDGNTALIGAPDDNNSAGTAWVFTRSGSTWSQQGSALAGGSESGEGNFGSSVALSGDGNTALIGGGSDNNFVGAAWAFTRSGTSWSQEGPKLTAGDEIGAADFGGSVALSGDGHTGVIGGLNDNNQAGAAWVFKPNFTGSGLTWTQSGPKLTPTDATSQASFGTAVALSSDGQTALIGGAGDNGTVGSAWLFAVGTWSQLGPKLTPSDAGGQANFGTAVALSSNGTTAVMGGLADNRSVGAAWAFAAKGPSLYWDNPQAGTVGVATGPPSQIDQSFITDIQPTHQIPTAADGQHIYWSAGGYIARANLDGSDVNPHFIHTSPAAIAVDGQHVYWTTFQSIGRANLDGSGVDATFISVAGSRLSGLAVDSSYLYWKDSLHRSIGRANLDGSGVTTAFIAGAGASLGAVAVTPDNVFWTNVTGTEAPFIGAIGRANIDGSGITPNFITKLDDPSGLALDDNFVYWASAYRCNYQNDPPTSCGGGTIGRANLDGTGVNPDFVTALGLEGPGCGTDPEIRCGPTSVTVATLPDGSRALYWDNPQRGLIGRETIDGDPGNVNQSLVTGIGQLFHSGVAVDRQHLYWTDGGLIGRSNLDGTGANEQFIQLGQDPADYLAVDDRYLYWSNPGGIGRVDLDGSNVTHQFINLRGDNVSGLAVDSSHIYWADRTHHTIGRANLDGSGVNTSFITGMTGVTDVAVDSQHIYWTQITTNGRPPVGSIGRANLDGTDVNQSFITPVPEPLGITVDYAHIYWTNAYNCNYLTEPASACAGGTIGRANLDGSGVNRAYITAAQGAGNGCDTSPPTRCGPSTVAVSAPTQPICLRTPLTPAPAPPPGGAVFTRPLDPSSSDANVVILPAGTRWTGDSSCLGLAQGSAQVMTHPATVSVSPDAALLLRDQPAKLFSAWGAQDVGAGDPAPVLFPGRSDWQTTEADMIAPQDLLDTYNGCPDCVLPNNITFTPSRPDPAIAYQDNVSHAVLDGAGLTGSFADWNLTGTELPGATFNGADVSGARFDGADLRGAQLTSLQSTTPPSFANVRVGADNGACTQFKNTNLIGTGLTPVKADLLVPGCTTSSLLPGSRVPLDLLHQLTVTDGATVDYADAQFLVTAANDAVLKGAVLNGITLDGASFLGFPADLEGTQFNGASLQGTSFQLADLAGAQFQSANAPGASFEAANLNGATFAQTTLSSPITKLQNADFIQADVSSANFESANISGAVFDDALAYSTSFDAVIATNTRFNGAHIYGDGQAFNNAKDLTGADFVGAVLAGSQDGSGGFNLTGATLPRAKFDRAQCIACNFTTATLTGATFTGAYLPGAQLSTAVLSDTSFDGAWLYCGSDASGNPSDASCTPDGSTQPQWPVALGSQESYGPVPFTSTTLSETEFKAVTVCPDGNPPGQGSLNPGCTGHLFPPGILFPNGPSTPPAPCSAVALDACPTTTSTVFDGSGLSNGAPISVAPAAPPTWSSTVTAKGYYVGLQDGTVRLVGSSAPTSIVAQSPDPNGLAVGLDGSLYIADPDLHQVRRLDPSGTMTTVAGTGTACTSVSATCGNGGQATAATLSGPYGVWASPGGELFIADGTRGIREVLPDGTITTVGPKAGSYDVVSIVGDASGNLYAATNKVTASTGAAPTNNADYLIQVNPASGQVSQVVGTGTSGYNGNQGTGVEVNHPQGLAVALNGNIVFADTGNHLIRAYVPSSGNVIDDLGGVIDDGVPQGGFTQDGSYANLTKFDTPAAVAVTRGALMVVADTGNARLRQIGPYPLPQLGRPLGHPPPPVTTPRPVTPPPGRPRRTQLPPPSHRPPHNQIAVSHIHVRRNGTITFAVRLPGPGRIDVLATAWKSNLAQVAVRLRPARHRFVYARQHARIRRPLTLHLTIAPNARGRRLVRHHSYPVTLRLWVSYTPTDGRPRSVGFSGLRLSS